MLAEEASECVVLSAKRPLPGTLYPKLQPGPRTVGAESVASNQRARLYGAMIELVSARGYVAGTVAELCALAGVSKRTLYERFPGGKRECFMATHAIILHRAHERIFGAGRRPPGAPCETEAGPPQPQPPRPRALVERFAREVAAHPNAAWLVLVEAVHGGPNVPALRERNARARLLCERALCHSLRASGEAPAPTGPVARRIVERGGRLVRARLREGRIEELERELAEVCLAAAGEALRSAPGPGGRRCPDPEAAYGGGA